MTTNTKDFLNNITTTINRNNTNIQYFILTLIGGIVLGYFFMIFSIEMILGIIFYIIISIGFLRFSDSILKDYEPNVLMRSIIYNLIYFVIITLFINLFIL